MTIKIGIDEGNSGAIIRYGKYLDKGLWIRRWKFRRLWFRWRIMQGYIDLGILVIQY